jgi:hypothetical protein
VSPDTSAVDLLSFEFKGSKLSNNKIPFGLKNGILIEVSQVESGLACGCVCPSCKRRLQANKGKIVSHYFSHDPSVETKACESAFETSIHLMAKQILSEDKNLNFPGLSVSVSGSDANGNEHVEEMQLEEESQRFFERVELEKRLEEIRPDIISYISGVPFLIEVAVTSFSGIEKRNKIRGLGISAIEIDLSKVGYTTTKSDLRELINSKLTKKIWLSNPKVIDAKRALQAKLDKKIQAINEGISRNRYTLKIQEVRSYRHLPKRTVKTNTVKKSSIENQYDSRWFVCEACRHIFKVPLRESPCSIETIPCPECGHEVSAKSC